MNAIAVLIASVKLVVAVALLALLPVQYVATSSLIQPGLVVATFHAPAEDDAGWDCTQYGNRRCYAGAHVQAQP